MAPGDVNSSLISQSRPPFSFASFRTLSISSQVKPGTGTGMVSFTRTEDGAWRRVWFTNWSAQSGAGRSCVFRPRVFGGDKAVRSRLRPFVSPPRFS